MWGSWVAPLFSCWLSVGWSRMALAVTPGVSLHCLHSSRRLIRTYFHVCIKSSRMEPACLRSRFKMAQHHFCYILLAQTNHWVNSKSRSREIDPSLPRKKLQNALAMFAISLTEVLYILCPWMHCMESGLPWVLASATLLTCRVRSHLTTSDTESWTVIKQMHTAYAVDLNQSMIPHIPFQFHCFSHLWSFHIASCNNSLYIL